VPASPWFTAIVALFVTTLVVSNVIAVKLFEVGGLVLPAGVVIFPLSYIVGDVLTEVYGYARARRVIWLGFACNLLAVVAIWVAIALPPAGFWASSQAAYETVLGFTPRLLVASFAAYLVGEFANAAVLAKMKVATRGRYLWMRTIGSTLIGQAVDSLIFYPLAFYGMPDWPVAALGAVMLSQFVLKVGWEVLLTPVTYPVVGWLKRKEGVDVYDVGTDFTPFTVED
jgi:uncharacterized integral membrane protein (TIGR00697 family)